MWVKGRKKKNMLMLSQVIEKAWDGEKSDYLI